MSFNRKRKDLDHARIVRDEKSILQFMDTVCSMMNPFSQDSPEELVNICSGLVANKKTTDDIATAYDKGDLKFKDFVQTRLLTEHGDIFSKMSKLKLATFKSLEKPKSAKTANGNIVPIKNDCRFWARLLLIAKNREIDLEEVFTYCLQSYPGALATYTGGLAKTVKSKLLHLLESETNNVRVEHLPVGSVLILDAMAILQTVRNLPNTFGEFAESLLDRITSMGKKIRACRVDFVSDRYPAISTKNAERQKRASAGVQTISILSDKQRVPRQWKKFLGVGSNKESLIKFIVEYWQRSSPEALKGIDVYATTVNKCFSFKASVEAVVVEEVPLLESDHEEADTRMLLHAKHAAAHADTIVIKSPDTDVFVFAIACCLDIGVNIIFETGTGNNQRRLSINSIATTLGSRWCKALIGFHMFTGWSTYCNVCIHIAKIITIIL